MTETFTWKSEVGGTSGSGEFKMATAQFGDGYSQDASIGLNPERQKWPVSVSGFRAQLAPVIAFIREHAGVTPFYWTPPLGVQGFYKAKTWSLSPNGGDHYTLTMEFEQTYGSGGVTPPTPLYLMDMGGAPITDMSDVPIGVM